ncbi:MAG: hypothetical protein M5R42_18500 [Rhodocyclaceae bacterium]|nr:hypothetical protein [Rhodocyclaceae bacterium]
MKLKRILGVMAVAGLTVPGMAWATNGYFSHGYGMKAKGMGGVGIALPQDALAAATNPAGMVMVGDRLDVGVDWFRPIRDSEIVGSLAPGVNGDYNGSDQKNFFVPEFGYNKMLGWNMSLGVSVYGNGGMNTNYKNGFPCSMACPHRSGWSRSVPAFHCADLRLQDQQKSRGGRFPESGLSALQGLWPAELHGPGFFGKFE